MPLEDWMTTAEAAALSGYNEEYVRRLVRTQKLVARRFGPVWQVNRPALLDYLRAAKRVSDKRRGPRSAA